MNLTSKRMLQFLSVCAGAFALTATAQTVYVEDNFEAEGVGYTNAAINDAAGMYKAHVWGTQSQYTNLVWAAGAGDASTIQAFDGTYANGRPITNANAQAQALKLETEGQTLTRYVAFTQDDGSASEGIPLTTPATVSFAAEPIYVDTLIKFTPSEDDPEITDPNIKVAIFVNVNSNLVVRHKYTDGNNLLVTNSVFETMTYNGTPWVINPEQWYRLTLKVSLPAVYGGNLTAVEIWVDGTQLTHSNGAVSQTLYSGGGYFFSLKDGVTTLEQVSFQGTGYVDDLVVARDITPFGGQTAIMLTLAFNDDLLDVTADGTPVTPNAEVESGATLTINAIDWYQIDSVTGEGITFSGGTGDMTNMTAGTISADVAGRTATIAASQYAGGTVPTGLAAPYDTVPADKLAAWAVASGLSEQDVALNAADYLDNYLLNIDESISAQLEVSSIVLDDVNSVAIITVGATDPAVDFTDLNGTLVVWTTDDLGTAFANPTTHQITATGAAEVTIQVPYAAGKFIKAVVQ